MIKYKCGDLVSFFVYGKEYKYQVACDHLCNLSKEGTIWEALSFKCPDIKKFCEEAFGYTPQDVTFFHKDDYDAANRLIQALQKRCDLIKLRDADIWNDNIAVASCKGLTTDYKYGDYVVFKIHGKQCTYRVGETKLEHVSGAFIFYELRSSGKISKEFCKKAFGYPPEGCCGDNYKREDYAAASRLIKALEEECAEETYRNRKPEEVTACGPIKPTIEAPHVGRPEEVTSRSPKPLRYKKGDKVIFNVRGKSYEYEVCGAFLCGLDMCSTNDIIFKALNIETPVNFCTAAYGYTANPVGGNGAFPECKDNDIEALNRVIEALQIECQHFGYEVSSKGYGTPSKEFMDECKRWDTYHEEKDKAKEALLTVRKSNTCKF